MNMKAMAIALGLVLAQGAVWADGVTRTLQKDGSIYHVTLSWTFSGSIDSDLVIEENFPDGWKVDAVPTDGTLDATWVSKSGSTARFAVNPTNLVETGSFSFDVKPDPGAATGSIGGNWWLYLAGTLQSGEIDANDANNKNLVAPVTLLTASSPMKLTTEATEEQKVELPVAIKSFKMLAGSRIELSYGALPAAGRLVVEGCEGLGKDWQEIMFKDVEAVADKVELDQATVGNRRFMRMKLYTKEQK